MQLSRRQTTFLYTILAGLYLFTAWLQSNLICGWDVSWGMHLASCLLNGGIYGKDYAEINPPMFIYLYLPPMIMAKYFAINHLLALQIYIFLLSILSLLICLRLAKNVFLAENTLAYCLFIITLAVIYLLIPTPSLVFGQREHLLMLLIMPYFLLIACRMNQKDITPISALGIGLLAGLGFAIKPYFVITFALVEFYYCFYKRTLFALLRIESLAVLGVLILYILSVIIFFRDYLTDMLPLAIRYYYPGYRLPWGNVIFRLLVIFSLMVAIVGLARLTRKTFFTFPTLLLMALLGFLAAYFIQKTGFNYHIYPAYSLAVLLSVLYFYAVILQDKSSYLRLMLSCSQGLSIAFILCCYTYGQYQFFISYKHYLQPIITFIHVHAWQQPVYFLSTDVFDEFPAVDYAGAIPASRYGMLFWIPAIQKLDQLPMNDESRLQYKNDAATFVNTVADELNTKKPVLVIIQKNNFHLNKPIDFVRLFSQNTTFNTAWKKYTYLTTIDTFEIYKRINK